jgi:hypothetical protein
MKTKTFLTFTLLSILLGVLPRTARAEERADGMRFVPNVIDQFEALTEYADPLGFHTGGSPDPSSCKHYQAMVRVDGADGTPFFLMTKSGNQPDDVPAGCVDGDNETGFGYLIVFRMGSRDKNGERLRSNRLSKLGFVDQTQPPDEDAASIYYTVTENGLVLRDGEGGTPPRTFQHPGGMQVVGHMLALVAEHPCQFTDVTADCEPTSSNTMIFFIDVTDPEHPVMTSKFSTQDILGNKAGVVGITPVAGGRYMLVTTGGDGERFHFFKSTLSDLSSPDLSWDFMGSIPGPILADAHQTLNFLRQGDINGPLYLAGARGSPIFDDRDRINLYEVNCIPSDCGPGARVDGLTQVVAGKRISPFPTTFGERLANLAAASTFYVSPSGELIFYATEHDNDGPGRTVKAGEWRHRDVVRDDSPTLLPHADLEESYEVEEGDPVTLTGTGKLPVTRAWIELFKQHDAQDICTVVDYDDALLDDFDNLGRLCVFGTEDGVRSWSWYAPAGCSIRATHTLLGGVKTLRGTGRIERDSDLSTVLNDAGISDMEKRVNKVVFEGDCDAYYDTGVDLEWDLDLDGVFETTGTEVTFNSAGLDGPSVVSVPVQAVHPESTLPGPAVAKVVVRNRIPVIRDMVVTDGAGHVVPSEIPFVLAGLPVTLRVDFSDPGIPDHQTAGIAWGDGVSDPHTAFTSFNDAFGGVIGHAVASHVFTSPAEFKMIVTVTDDDGGAEVDSAKVKVVSVEQALDVAIDLLQDKIAATSNPVIRKILEKAFKALYGNSRAQNGALEMIRTGNDESAIVFLSQTIGWLNVASGFGADVSTLIAILQQMIVALSAGL